MASTPAKRVCGTEVTDLKLCLMSEKRWRSRPVSNSLKKLLDSVRERATYGNPSFLPITSRLCGFQQSELESHAVSWHRTCYQNAIHAAKIQRAKERFEKSVLKKDVTVVTNVKKGRPLTPALLPSTQPIRNQETLKPFTRSSAIQYNNNMCIFCNEDGTRHDLH